MPGLGGVLIWGTCKCRELRGAVQSIPGSTRIIMHTCLSEMHDIVCRKGQKLFFTTAVGQPADPPPPPPLLGSGFKGLAFLPGRAAVHGLEGFMAAAGSRGCVWCCGKKCAYKISPLVPVDKKRSRQIPVYFNQQLILDFGSWKKITSPYFRIIRYGKAPGVISHVYEKKAWLCAALSFSGFFSFFRLSKSSSFHLAVSLGRATSPQIRLLSILTRVLNIQFSTFFWLFT